MVSKKANILVSFVYDIILFSSRAKENRKELAYFDLLVVSDDFKNMTN